MFQSVEPAPPDAILGLSEAFKADPRENKVNLTVGVYANAEGVTPVLSCVKAAERLLLEQESSKTYLGIDGLAEYDQFVPRLILGDDHPVVNEQRVITVQTPGGTGALRVAADWLSTSFPNPTVWLSTPTWPNHPNVFRAGHCAVQSYAYYDMARNEIDFAAMCASLGDVQPGDIVVLHGCCHNPTGADLKGSQWHEVASILKQREAVPLVDFAYQGLAEGLDEDAAGLRVLADALDELIVCSSFSKNFGLYRERVGALTVVADSSDAAAAVLSRLKKCVRCNYSNPPSHGASIVATVLGDAKLTQQWQTELATMRNRINEMRKQLAEIITAMDCPVDFRFMQQQRGMFSLTGLSPAQVQRLRDERAVYIVGNGRINLAGLNQNNVQYVAESIASVLS
jgi:aspartate/tyrosine/aromatic aminotransferase